MSMATIAEGTRRWLQAGFRTPANRGRKRAKRTRVKLKGEGQKPSARVSWRRLSCQKTTATAKKINAEGTADRNAAEEMHRFCRGPESQDSSGYGGRTKEGSFAYKWVPSKKRRPARA